MRSHQEPSGVQAVDWREGFHLHSGNEDLRSCPAHLAEALVLLGGGSKFQTPTTRSSCCVRCPRRATCVIVSERHVTQSLCRKFCSFRSASASFNMSAETKQNPEHQMSPAVGDPGPNVFIFEEETNITCRFWIFLDLVIPPTVSVKSAASDLFFLGS